MVKKILAILTGPFAIALGIILLLAIGAGGGVVIAGKMEEASQKRRAELKAAEEAAKRGPAPPERVRATDASPNPFEPRYVEMGDEILSNLPSRGRAMIVEFGVITMRGERAEKILTEERLRLRALAGAVISETTVEMATAPGAMNELAQRLRAALNGELREKIGADPIDEILIKRYFVQ